MRHALARHARSYPRAVGIVFANAFNRDLSGTWRVALASLAALILGVFALARGLLQSDVEDLIFAVPMFVAWAAASVYVVYDVREAGFLEADKDDAGDDHA